MYIYIYVYTYMYLHIYTSYLYIALFLVRALFFSAPTFARALARSLSRLRSRFPSFAIARCGNQTNIKKTRCTAENKKK